MQRLNFTQTNGICFCRIPWNLRLNDTIKEVKISKKYFRADKKGQVKVLNKFKVGVSAYLIFFPISDLFFICQYQE